jgi:hypothetical protein
VQRRSSAILIPLSLALFLAMGTLWMLSFFWYASVTNVPPFNHPSANRSYSVYLHAGMIEFTTWTVRWKNSRPKAQSSWQLTAWHAKFVLRDLQSEFLMGLPKFRWRAGTMPLRKGFLAEEHLWISYAYPTLLFALAPLAWLRRFARQRAAKRAGHCQGCGYDLRASPQRCPECGAIPASQVAAIASRIHPHPTG